MHNKHVLNGMYVFIKDIPKKSTELIRKYPKLGAEPSYEEIIKIERNLPIIINEDLNI